MSLTFGYDLKDGDKILEAPNQLASDREIGVILYLIYSQIVTVMPTLVTCILEEFAG